MNVWPRICFLVAALFYTRYVQGDETKQLSLNMSINLKADKGTFGLPVDLTPSETPH